MGIRNRILAVDLDLGDLVRRAADTLWHRHRITLGVVRGTVQLSMFAAMLCTLAIMPTFIVLKLAMMASLGALALFSFSGVIRDSFGITAEAQLRGISIAFPRTDQQRRVISNDYFWLAAITVPMQAINGPPAILAQAVVIALVVIHGYLMVIDPTDSTPLPSAPPPPDAVEPSPHA